MVSESKLQAAADVLAKSGEIDVRAIVEEALADGAEDMHLVVERVQQARNRKRRVT